MCLIEYDDAILNDFLVVVEQVSVEEVVVGHDEEGSEVFGLHRVEIGTENLLPPYFLHYVDVQQSVGQPTLTNRHHLFPLLVKETRSL